MGPRFHFHDSSCGNNDPNAPLYDPVHRLFHVFYQSHEPGGTVWGHGVSADAVYWAHLPTALWNNEWWDYTAVFSGSATFVEGKLIILYPGLCVTKNETTCPNTPANATGITINSATPVNTSDPFLTSWRKNSWPLLNSTSSDPSTAWRTASGEWRFTLEDTSVYASKDFSTWKPASGVSGFWPSDCPDFFSLAEIVNGSSATRTLPREGPTHAHKGGACVPSVGLGDFYQLGTYTDGADGTTGTFRNLTALTGTDAFIIGDGSEGSEGPWGGAWNCTADPTHPTVLPLNYAAKSFMSLDARHGPARRINWQWLNVNNPGGVGETASAGMLGVPTELTYEPQLRRLINVPLAELAMLRTYRIGGCHTAQLPQNSLNSDCGNGECKDSAAALWMNLPPEAVLEHADYVASFPLPLWVLQPASVGIHDGNNGSTSSVTGCTELGMIFTLSPATGANDRRNVSVYFRLCPESAAVARTGSSRPSSRPAGAPRGVFEAHVDMRNGTACNKLYMTRRDNCATSARFELLPRDLAAPLDLRVLIDATVMQVFFAGGRVVLTAPWPGPQPGEGGGRDIVDVGLFSTGTQSTSGAIGTLDVYAMGDIWVTSEEVLRRRDAIETMHR